MPKFITIEQKNDAVCEAIQAAYSILDASVRTYDYTNLATDSNFIMKSDTNVDGSLYAIMPDDVLAYNDNLLCLDLTNVNNYDPSGSAAAYNDAVTIAIKWYDTTFGSMSGFYMYVRDDSHRPINIAMLKGNDAGAWEIHHLTTGHAARITYGGSSTADLNWTVLHEGVTDAGETSLPFVTQSGVSKCKKSVLSLTTSGMGNFAYHVPGTMKLNVPVSVSAINEVLVRNGQEVFFAPTSSNVGTAVRVNAIASIHDNGRIVGYNNSAYLDSSLSVPTVAGSVVSMGFSIATGAYATFGRVRHELVSPMTSVTTSNKYFLIDNEIVFDSDNTTVTMGIGDKLIKK